MRDIETILVPIDFSEYAKAAMYEAIGLAQRCGARLHLLHVMPTLGVAGDLLRRDLPDVLVELRDAAARKLQKAEQTVKGRDVEVTAAIAEGDCVRQILDTAAKCGANLIVMGTHGYSGLKHVILGSVAERTLRHAPCPVMAVKFHEGDEITARVSFQTIVVPVDGSLAAERAIEVATQLARTETAARIILLHAYFVPADLVVLRRDRSVEFLKRLGTSARAHLEALLSRVEAEGVACEIRVLDGTPVPVIHDVVKAESANLIVMGTRGRTGLAHAALGSIAERVVRTATCPVVTVRRDEVA